MYSVEVSEGTVRTALAYRTGGMGKTKDLALRSHKLARRSIYR